MLNQLVIPFVLSGQAIVMLAGILCFSYAIHHMKKGDTDLAFFFVFSAIFIKMLEMGLLLSIIVGNSIMAAIQRG